MRSLLSLGSRFVLLLVTAAACAARAPEPAIIASTIFASRLFASRSPRLTKPLPQHQLGLKRSGDGREWPWGGTSEGCGASHLVGDAS